jgi:DNA primase
MPSPNDARAVGERASLSRDDIEAIRERHPIEQVIAAYADLRSAGRHLTARCPLPGHNDHNPSFVVYPDEGRFWCFGCQRGGDVFAFIQLVEQVSFREAVERLEFNGCNAVPRGSATPPLSKAPQPPHLDDRALDLLTAAAEVYHAALLLNREMLQYVTGRGITQDSIRRFRLGYATGDNLAKYFRFRGWDPELGRELGLINDRGEFFRHRIILPEWRKGKAVYLTGRKTMDYQRVKYLGLPGAPKPLYGLESSQGTREILICEGAFDFLTLIQWGYPAVALLGSHLKREWFSQLAFAERLFIVTDSDEAGRTAARELVKLFGERAITVLPLPQAKDVNELAMRPDGQQVFARLMAAARSNMKS